MKYLAILLLVTACSAHGNEYTVPKETYTSIAVVDTIRLKDTIYIGVTPQVCIRMQKQRDSATTALFIANYRVERVRFYLNICMRDKTQDKFLKGWVRRAIE